MQGTFADVRTALQQTQRDWKIVERELQQVPARDEGEEDQEAERTPDRPKGQQAPAGRRSAQLGYCVLGSVGAYTRYGIIERGVIVDTQISKPDGVLLPTPHPLVYKRRPVESAPVKMYLFNNPLPTTTNHNGEQPRRPVWSRAGKRAAPQ